VVGAPSRVRALRARAYLPWRTDVVGVRQGVRGGGGVDQNVTLPFGIFDLDSLSD